jgi:hypothetical protein
MLDKVLATIAIACLIGFVSVLITYIRELDLTIVSVVVLIMASYDFFLLNTEGSGQRTDEQEPPR